MKLVTFEREGERGIGAWRGENAILDLTAKGAAVAAGEQAYRDMISFISGGERVLDQARTWLAGSSDEALVAPSEVRLLAPLPVPTQIRDFANYELHVRQAIASSMRLRANATPDPEATLERFRQAGLFDIPAVWYEQPLYYKGNRLTVVGPDADVVWPRFARLMDYELELAVVIGGPAKDLTDETAMSAVFGYTIYNDFSARDAQARETQFRMGPAKGKDFDTGNALGPCIVTKDEIADPENLAMSVRVNGQERLRSSSAGAQHSIVRCLTHISASETLHPGELIGLGTVGDGCGYESLTFLEDGDVVELEIEQIGVLRNRLVRA
jgi:2-keto-4-pentenoate hydratase/2-oxohepta-3-ene-1,7-dioic acid hydratase in catechol pathway